MKIYDININALLNVVADMLGIKSASQAYDEGSIPFTRSRNFIDQFLDDQNTGSLPPPGFSSYLLAQPAASLYRR
ncbi:hypothetical protein [Insolitispirillum peregrinum]|uniref:hypothetical protein n=1 Tax=Insolitispirillum peregrinum TaxID=80876 RepID=UPI0036060A53